jgi:hypothetical protein
MAIKQFAIPLNDKSLQSGDINFKALVDNGAAVTFQISHVSSGSTNQLNLITTKNGTQISHVYTAIVFGSSASANLTATQMAAVYNDSDGVDWDYVEAHWTLGAVDTPSKSNMDAMQNQQPYDTYGWPPKMH